MRILFVSRRMLVNLSLLGVVVCLVGVLKLLGGSPTVTAWVSAGLEAGQAPLFLAGNPQNQAVSLLVQLGAECDEQQLGQMLHILADNSAGSAGGKTAGAVEINFGGRSSVGLLRL